MKNGYKSAIITLLLILIGIIVYNVLIQNGIIRNYHIKDFVIDVNIKENGDVVVKEDTIYRFNGEYNGITITIPTNVSSEYYERLTKDSMNDSTMLPDSLYISNGIEDVKIYTLEDGIKKVFYEKQTADIGDSGVFTETIENGFTTYTIYEPSKSEDKQFIIEYTLKNVMVQHNDVAELFWNFIGGKVECKIKRLELNIYGSSIKQAYTHGNSSGRISNTLNGAKIRYSNIKPNEYVSARIIEDRFSNTISKKSGINALPLVEELEKSYSDKKALAVGLNNFAIIMTAIIFAYWVFLLLKYENEIEPVPLVADELELLNKYNPMIAACIAQNRDMHPRDILAVLIDLVNVKALKMVHIRGSVIGSAKDTYNLSKNEEFFNDVEKFNKLDDIQKSVIDIFFDQYNTIELTERLKQIKSDSRAIEMLKGLDDKVSIELSRIGANFLTTPKWLRVWNTFVFIGICIYILFMAGVNITLRFITLSTTNQEMLGPIIASAYTAFVAILILLPLLFFVIKGIVNLINLIRKSISKIAFKLTTKRLTRKIMTFAIIFIMVILFEIFVLKSVSIIVMTILFFAALLVILTDNLMTTHDTSIQKQYVVLKLVQDKIENGSLLDEKRIQDNILWNKYFTFAIALGLGDVAIYVKHIPDFSTMESIVDDFYKLTDGYYGLYGLHREMVITARLNKFTSTLDHITSIWLKAAASGGGSGSSGGFSSGGGRFSGGGGRGGGRGAF